MVAVLGLSTRDRPSGGARTDVGVGTLVVADIGPGPDLAMTLVSMHAQPTCVARVTRRVAMWMEYTAGEPDRVFEGLVLAGCAERQGERWLVAIDGSHPDARRIAETIDYDPYRWTFFAAEPRLVLSPSDVHADALDVDGCTPRGATTRVFVGEHPLANRGLDGEPFAAEVGNAHYLVIHGLEELQVARLGRDDLEDERSYPFPAAYDCD